MVGSLSLGHKIIGFFVLFAGFFMISGVSSNSKVYADCGANGATIHGYAGAVIDVRIRSSTGVVREAPQSTPVYVRAVNPSTPAGNIYDLDSGRRFIAGNFTQIDNSCPGNQGSHSAVFGYGRTSQPTGGPNGEWALDCDRSVRGTSNQPFTATGQGTPAGAIALYGSYVNNPSYGWTVAPINPTNGTTQYTFITYREPPPPPTLANTGTINFLDCRNFTSFGLIRKNALPVRWIVLMRATASSAPTVWINETYNGSTVYSFPRNFPSGTPPYYLELQVLDTTGANPVWRIVDTATNQNSSCTPQPPIRPTYTLEASCQGLWVRGLIDRDNPNAGVRIAGQIKHRYTSSGVTASGPIQNFDLDNQSGDVLIPWPWASDDNINQGWRLELTVYDTNPRGEKINPQYMGPADLADTTCYSATCTILGVTPAVHPSRPTGVEAGRAFTATVRLVNRGKLPIPANTLRAAYDYPAGNRVSYASTPVGPIPAPANPAAPTAANMATATISVTAPNDVSSWAVYPYLFDKYALGGACGSIDTFVQYRIKPIASAINLGPNGDLESPTQATFVNRAEKEIPAGGMNIPGINISRTVINKSTGATVGSIPSDAGATLGAVDRNSTVAINPSDLTALYCGIITVSPAAGWVGPGGSRVDTNLSDSDETATCAKIVSKPYIRAYGGDVVAGAVFPDNSGACVPSSNADILANTRPMGTGKSGSGGQLAVMAPRNIKGFVSASLRAANPTLPIGLMPGGVAPATGSSDLSPQMGGSYGADKCLKDYFTTQQFSDESGDIVSVTGPNPLAQIQSMPSNEKQSKYNTSTLTLGGVDGFAKRHSMFVEGNVEINGDIKFKTTYANSSEIPSLRVFVKGDIYISKDVTQIDGIYVAQPRDDGTGGNIYTCSNVTSNIVNPAQRFTECRRQLTVYGSFIANKVHLGRIANSIRDSVDKENYPFSGAANPTKAAEVFIFSPEVYFANTAVRPTSSSTSGEYQYIATLPPIL